MENVGCKGKREKGKALRQTQMKVKKLKNKVSFGRLLNVLD